MKEKVWKDHGFLESFGFALKWWLGVLGLEVTNVFESSKEMRIDLMLTALLVATLFMYMKISKIYSGMVDYSSRSNQVDIQI